MTSVGIGFLQDALYSKRMVGSPDFAREMRPVEVDSVDALLRAAFLTGKEADLVRRLRTDGDMVSELVIEWEGEIAAYAALSRMRAPSYWLCLAPVAVLPRFRNGVAAPSQAQRNQYRFGTRLVQGIVTAVNTRELEQLGSTVVYGSPSFYGRCGFSLERAAQLTTPYDVEHTLLAAPGDDVPQETLVYPIAFEDSD